MSVHNGILKCICFAAINCTYLDTLQIKECDGRLLSIRVPDSLSRTPKTLEEYHHWKGTWHSMCYKNVHVID